MIPEPIKKFADAFSTLPSIGPRQALRLAFHVANSGRTKVDELVRAVFGLTKIQTCAQCFFTYENNSPENTRNICGICANPQRRKDLVAIVEKETDLISLEKTKKFGGRYLVLGELNKDGVLDVAQKLRINTLKRNPVSEIIIAINPTTYGDLNAALIAQELKSLNAKITRLGRGIPTGGEIEFADEETLGAALERRL